MDACSTRKSLASLPSLPFLPTLFRHTRHVSTPFSSPGQIFRDTGSICIKKQQVGSGAECMISMGTKRLTPTLGPRTQLASGVCLSSLLLVYPPFSGIYTILQQAPLRAGRDQTTLSIHFDSGSRFETYSLDYLDIDKTQLYVRRRRFNILKRLGTIRSTFPRPQSPVQVCDCDCCKIFYPKRPRAARSAPGEITKRLEARTSFDAWFS